MPEMDGFQSTEKILEALHDSQEGPSAICNIVALTSYTDQKTRERCLDLGMKDVYNKPLDASSLKRILLLYYYGLSETQLEEYLIEESLKHEKESQLLQSIHQMQVQEIKDNNRKQLT